MLTKRAAAATVALATLVGCVVLPGPAQAHPGLPSSVFDRNEVSWASLRDYSLAGIDAKLDTYPNYLALDVESDVVGATHRFGAVLQYNVDGRASRVSMRMSAGQFATARTDAAADGLRFADFEAITEGGVQYYAAAWVEDRENLDTRQHYNLTGDQAQSLYEQLRGTHMPVDIDAYQTSAGLRFASIWVRNTEGLSWTLRRSVTSAEFDAQTATLGSGYRLLGFDSVPLSGGAQNYSGIWVENRNGRFSIFQRDLTEIQYENRWYRHRDEGYRLVGYERYETANGTRYAGLWRQNSARPNWTLRSAVTARVNQEVADFDVPGMSVAVIQNGQFRYQRGFGYANVDDVVWMDSTHVQRLASVSKAVAGVLTLRLADQGQIAVGNQTRSYDNAMPTRHSHTIQQLVSNRGCVGHYGDMPAGVNNTLSTTRYATARAAAPLIWNAALVSPCTIGTTEYYSTHGYTLLGAAFEGATGTPVATLVRNEITTPFGLDTLQPEDRTVGSVRRTTLYEDDNDEATPDQISWKVLGGGLESSVADLARFGDLLIRDQILTQARQNQMWVNTGWDYAYGWDIATVGGRLRVTKSGGQLGANSYLLMYPNDGIVVAVMSNRQNGGHSAGAVARAIGTMITDTL